MVEYLGKGNFKTEDSIYVASALEQYAYEYKENIEAPYFLRSRKIVVDYLLRCLKPNSRVLDINCGTGLDIVEIAKHKHEVMGVDISSTMISFASENINKAGLNSNARAEVCDYRELPVTAVPFDAVLSNFGGINFVKELTPVFSSIDRNLKDGGILIVNSIGHFCFMEFLIFFLSGKFDKAFRRLNGGKARIGGKYVSLFYHRKKELLSAGLKFNYRVMDIFGVNIFTPPLWADEFFKSHERISRELEKADEMLRNFPILRTAGDFMVVVFKKGEK